MNVTWWYNAEFVRWNGAIDGEEDVNGTGRSFAEMQGYIVESYNRKHGQEEGFAPVTPESFTYSETDPPAPQG